MKKTFTITAAVLVAMFGLTGCTDAITDVALEALEPSVSAPESTEPVSEVVEPETVETPAEPIVEAPVASVSGLDTLVVSEPVPGEYNREEDFGTAWADVDQNGCDTRNDVLNLQLSNIVKEGNCKVLSGSFVDPYTGVGVDFVRGQKTSILAPVDHIYSLKGAWMHGAQTWTTEKRTAFANDPENLTVTSQAFNSWKSAKNPYDMFSSPSKPSDFVGTCFYATKFVNIAVKYGLSITKNDKQVLQDYLATC